MLGRVLQDAINEQIKNEFYSAYLYLSMAAFSEAGNLPGFAHWFRLQSQEEVAHAMRLFDHVHDRGGRVLLHAIDLPPLEFESPLGVFQQTLEHERKVTAMIHRLYETAAQEKDYATQVELQWFIAEQVEEEKTASQIVETLKQVGDTSQGLLLLDRQLGSRKPG